MWPRKGAVAHVAHDEHTGWAGARGGDSYRAAAAGLPAALRFLALFVASLLVSALQLRWVPVTESHQLAIGVLAFVVPLQVIGCLYGFLCRDVVASTGMGGPDGWPTR